MKSKIFATKPIIFGIGGKVLSPQEKEFFENNHVIGFILFARNIESSEQLRDLTSSLKGLYPDREVPIFVDQEGGRVARIKPPIVDKLHPPAGHFSEIYMENEQNGLKAIKENYCEIMSELNDLGIDSPCAPVADLRWKGAHEVIGDRSLGYEVEQVVDLAGAAIEGIVEKGGIPIIKHMPGHGRALSDSHLELPRVTAPLEELNKTDFEVFRQLSNIPNVFWAMTAHIVFDCIDPEKPVTCSKKGIEFIREQIGFKGIILSDAIEMLALHGEVGAIYGAIKAAIANLKSSGEIKQETLEALKRLGAIDEGFDSKTQEEQNSDLTLKKPEIDKEFTDSLVRISQETLASGCNVVLHCTGDFNQIKAIGESIELVTFEL